MKLSKILAVGAVKIGYDGTSDEPILTVLKAHGHAPQGKDDLAVRMVREEADILHARKRATEAQLAKAVA